MVPKKTAPLASLISNSDKEGHHACLESKQRKNRRDERVSQAEHKHAEQMVGRHGFVVIADDSAWPSLATSDSEETVESRPIISVDAAATGLQRKAPVVQSRIIRPLVSADVKGVTAVLDDACAGTANVPDLSKKPNVEILSSPFFATTALSMQSPVVVKGLASASNVAHNITLSATPPFPQTGLPPSSMMSKEYI